MKKLALVVMAGLMATGCSPFLHPGMHPGMYPTPGPYFAPPAHHRPALEPMPTGRWDNVMRLPRLTTIDVLMADGTATIGHILGATAQAVTISVGGTSEQIARVDVMRIDLVDLPGSRTGSVAAETLKGAALGTGAAMLFAGVLGGDFWPPPGVALRAGAALGGAAGLERELMRRRQRIIYLAPEQRIHRRQ